MNIKLFALALVLSLVPAAALAQDSNAPPQLTPAQRQAMHQTFEQFAQQEEQLHQQLRYQILSALTPVHRREVGATIGELAISANPDLDAAAKRLDAMLSAGEQQRILAAHSSFVEQSRQLHDQLHAALESQLPAGHPDWMNKQPPNGAMQPPRLDAGTLLLMDLSPHPMMQMMMHGGMMHMEGAPPQ
ncbi:MAG TPA: hypothetical protein VFF63_09130 [Candidatus Babeliales bacterium]|nr:hypothetical protein [Candidatus Babeliales bacterium]